MNYEEAIAIFERNNYIDTLGGFPYSEEEQKIVDAYNIIEQILERQIPKKLVPSKGLYKKLRGDMYPITCPTCGCGFTENADYKHCPNCGQALDWE